MQKISILKQPDLILGGGNSCTLFRDLASYGIDNTSAGMQVEFLTTSTNISISYTAIKHVHCKAVFGVSLTKGILYHIKNTQGVVIKRGICLNKNLAIEENHIVYASTKSQTLICTFYLPYMVAVSQMNVFIDDGSNISPTKNDKKSIVFLGGINTLGSGCTFQNTTMPFIVSDYLKLQPINLARNSSQIYNEGGLQLLAEIKPRYVVCELFFSNTDLKYMEENILSYVEKVTLASPTSRIIFWGFPLSSLSLDLNKKHKLFRDVKRLYSLKNSSNSVFLDCGELFSAVDYDKYTTSANYMNDYANYRLAEKIIETIKALG